MKTEFIIPLNGLKPGKTAFSWKAGVEFFSQFDNNEILDADISVEAIVEKSNGYLGVDGGVDGTLTVLCDRCGDEVTLPVNADMKLSIKFGTEPVSGESTILSDEREIVYLPEDGGDLDLSQTVYDFACLALPMQRVHPEGECNPMALRYLSDGDIQDRELKKDNEDNPFAVLKGLIDN